MRQYFRAYPAISSRQQGADRLVYNEDDFRKVLWQAVDPDFSGERPSTIRLGADIYLTRPIQLGAYQYNVTIDGAGRFGVSHTPEYPQSYSYMFYVPPGAVRNLSFRNVAFTGDSLLVGLFDGSGSLFRLSMEDCTVDAASLFGASITVQCSNLQLNNTPGITVGGTYFSGTITYRQSPSVGGFAESLVHQNEFGEIFSRTPDGVLCGQGARDVSLTVDGGLEFGEEHQVLSGVDPKIVIGNRTLISVTVGSTCSGNIRFGGTVFKSFRGIGQILTLVFREIASGSSLKLGSYTGTGFSATDDILVNKNYNNKIMRVGETVTFINGTWLNPSTASFRTAWIEIARSENS